MRDYSHSLIYENESVRVALNIINEISERFIMDPLTLFVLDEHDTMVGTLTDGDIRRNLLKGHSIDEPVRSFMNRYYQFLKKNDFTIQDVKSFYRKNIKMIPVLDENHKIVRVYDLTKHKSILPIDAVIMAGGEGRRLRPLTASMPKPMLKVGSKPIIEHNLDRLFKYGIDHVTVSVRYLGDKLIKYLGDGSRKGMHISYIREKNPMGTMGSLSLIDEFEHDYILLMNSDLLTTIDYENFFCDFLNKKVDMAVASVPYEVKVPYAVLHVNGEHILSFNEKPELTYQSNAGIYLMKRELISRIPGNQFWDVTDFMDELIKDGGKIAYYPLNGYWLDIGKPEDFIQAQKDIKLVEM